MTDAPSRFAPLALVAAGFAVWAAFSLPLLTGRPAIREAWDSGGYWSVGLPLLLALVLAVGFVTRGRPWLLAACAIGGHVLAMVALAKPGTDLALLPLTVAFIGAPMFLVAMAAAWLGRRLRTAIE